MAVYVKMVLNTLLSGTYPYSVSMGVAVWVEYS